MNHSQVMPTQVPSEWLFSKAESPEGIAFFVSLSGVLISLLREWSVLEFLMIFIHLM